MFNLVCKTPMDKPAIQGNNDTPLRTTRARGPTPAAPATLLASALLLAVFILAPKSVQARLHGRRAAAAAAASTDGLDLTTPSPCGPANATHFGLRCDWEAPRPSGPTIPAANGTSLASAGDGAATTGTGVPFTFNTPPQCCCTQLLTTGNKPLRRLWASGGARCFPHAIVVGAQKGGTTALFAHFMMRPDFEAPEGKEVCVYGTRSINMNFVLQNALAA